MDFANRVKKEMTEGIVRAIFEDAGYRVIETGIERVQRETACMSAEDYKALGYPDAMAKAPDFTIMNREQDEKFLVEVKYRSRWGPDIFDEVQDQVRIFGEIILVSVWAGAEDPRGHNMPSRFLRCCGLKFDGGVYKFEARDKGNNCLAWRPVDDARMMHGLWWAMTPLHEKFSLLNDDRRKKTLFSAVEALGGILDA
jgi:hypothetical protein